LLGHRDPRVPRVRPGLKDRRAPPDLLDLPGLKGLWDPPDRRANRTYGADGPTRTSGRAWAVRKPGLEHVSRNLGSTYTVSTFTPDTAIKVTRIQAQAAAAPVGCTTNAVLTLSDGTTAGTRTLTVSTAENDSQPISVNYSAGAKLTLRVSTAASGCSRNTSINVVVQYKAQ